MTKIAYIDKNFKQESLDIIERANTIIAEYEAMNLTLTLRQLYYQFVSRDWLANTVRNYDKLGAIISDARLAGLVSWKAIEDRGRNLLKTATWGSPTEILESAAEGYVTDWWKEQENYVEVWIEKEALIGVVEAPCEKLQIPHFACKGYTSQSEMWAAAVRLINKIKAGKRCTIIHLGDHDPSGIDMTRDIQERLHLFISKHTKANFSVDRIALNMADVEKYNPPPNPAKTTDVRFAKYEQEFGDESWELDALSPEVIGKMIENKAWKFINRHIWEQTKENEQEARERLEQIAASY